MTQVAATDGRTSRFKSSNAERCLRSSNSSSAKTTAASKYTQATRMDTHPHFGACVIHNRIATIQAASSPAPAQSTQRSRFATGRGERSRYVATAHEASGASVIQKMPLKPHALEMG